MVDGPRPAGVVRVFYQELREGDRLKIQAASNVATTGGGARDLRISPASDFGPFFARMFPGKAVRTSNRRDVTVNVGPLRWSIAGTAELREIEIWPPTDPRPYELRIAQINRTFPGSVPEGDRVFVLLVENDRGEVWGHYVTAHELRGGGFNARVAAEIVRCMDRTPDHRSVRGYIDFALGSSYCLGK